MEETIKKTFQDAIATLGKDYDVLFIAHQSDIYGVLIQGDADSIAKSIFCQMFQDEQELSSKIFRVIQLIVMNLLDNPSPYAEELIKTMRSMINKKHE